jgi:TPR repeat protein
MRAPTHRDGCAQQFLAPCSRLHARSPVCRRRTSRRTVSSGPKAILPKVFISYRREDTPGHAGRLYDRLQQEFGPDNVFIDVDTLLPGDDFVDAIGQTLDRCDLMLALIGPRWLTAADDHGRPRLDDQNDFVRVEIQTALERRIRTVPVLVERAPMPQEQQLPEPLRPLTRRQAIELSDARWASDVGALVEKFKRAAPVEPSNNPNPLHGNLVSVPPGGHWGVWSGATALVLASLAILTMWLVRTGRSDPRRGDQQVNQALKLPVSPCRDDDDDANRCIRACDAGDAGSCTNLGLMYATGRGGLTKDEARAVAFYQRGCDGGNERGCTDLGRMYETGRGALTQDEARGMALFRRACDAGDALACTNLGRMYATGRGGLPKDEAQAAALYRRACDAGEAPGCIALGAMYEAGRAGLPKDESRAATLYQRGCDAGGPLGCSSLGVLYQTGRGGLPRDEARAVAFYQRGCDGGNPLGCTNLGEMYETGRGGLPKDDTRAMALFQRGCDVGHAAACRNLQRMRRQRGGSLQQ